LPEVIVGITEASITRKPATPCARQALHPPVVMVATSFAQRDGRGAVSREAIDKQASPPCRHRR
jgi:hypothetical protein